MIAAFLAVSLVLTAADSFDYRTIESAINTGEIDNALTRLQTRLKAFPDDARAHLLAGIASSEAGNSTAAQNHFVKASELAPLASAPHTNLGKLLASEGKAAEAQREFEKALSLEPADAGALSNLGLLLLTSKNFAAAAVQLTRAVELSPRDLEIGLALLQAQGANHQFGPARETAARLLAMAPEPAKMLQAVGTSQVQFGDYPEAIKNLRLAISSAPKAYEAQYNLGLAYDQSGDSSNAEIVLRALEERSPNPDLINLLGAIYEKNHKSVDAIRAYQEAAGAEPANENYRFDYICELIDHRSFEPAQMVAAPATLDFPRSMRIKLALGISLFGLHEYRAAQEIFVNAAKQFPESDLPLQIITFAPDTSDLPIPEAEALLEAQNKRHPERFLPKYLLGHVAFRSGNFPLSIEYLVDSLRENPAQPRAHYELGRAYFAAHDVDRAIREYKCALKLDPDLLEAQYRLVLAYKRTGDEAHADNAREQLRVLQENSQQAVIHRFLYSMR